MFYFEKLDVYRCSITFVGMAVSLSETIPKGYGAISDQLRRAALSVPLNIAEGSAKTGQERYRFYKIARGSALECAAILDVLHELRFSTTEQLLESRELLERIVSMLWKMTQK